MLNFQFFQFFVFFLTKNLYCFEFLKTLFQTIGACEGGYGAEQELCPAGFLLLFCIFTCFILSVCSSIIIRRCLIILDFHLFAAPSSRLMKCLRVQNPITNGLIHTKLGLKLCYNSEITWKILIQCVCTL